MSLKELQYKSENQYVWKSARIKMNLYKLDLHHQWPIKICAPCEVQQVWLLEQNLHPY